jgi:hypothetical protein
MDENQSIPNLPTDLSQSSTIIQDSTNQVSKAIQRKPRNYDKKVHGKRYTIAQKLAIKALQNTGLSPHEAQPIAGADRSTIIRIWEDKELDDLSPAIVNKVKSGLGGLFYKRALGATLAISEQKLSESSALQLATVAGIMTEKGRLMDGLSTENVSFRGLSQSIDSDRAKIMERIQALTE